MGAAVGMAVAAAAAAKAAVVAAVAVVVGVRRGDPGRSRSELAVQTFERRWPALDASATGPLRMVRTPFPALRRRCIRPSVRPSVRPSAGPSARPPSSRPPWRPAPLVSLAGTYPVAYSNRKSEINWHAVILGTQNHIFYIYKFGIVLGNAVARCACSCSLAALALTHARSLRWAQLLRVTGNQFWKITCSK